MQNALWIGVLLQRQILSRETSYIFLGFFLGVKEEFVSSWLWGWDFSQVDSRGILWAISRYYDSIEYQNDIEIYSRSTS